MKLRYLILALALLVCASQAHAQGTRNCSTITDSVIGGSHPAHGCNQWIWTLYSHYTDVWNILWSCANTDTLTVYRTGTETVSTNGECTSKLTTPFSGIVDCPGYYTTRYVGAPATGGTNYFYWYPRDRQIAAYLTGQLYCEDLNQPPKYTSCRAVICPINTSSPIVMSLDGEPFEFTDPENGVMFDLLGNGTPVKTAWTLKGANIAFLALPGPDGVVNGNQLFGNQHAANGFIELAVYDLPQNGGNGDGKIDKFDGIWERHAFARLKNAVVIFVGTGSKR